MIHKVEIEQSGRGGTIRYFEDNQELTFDWEFATNGAYIFVAPAEQWDINCCSRGAGWAAGRRQEILERLAEEVRVQKATSAVVSIEDNWIHLVF